MTPEQIAAEIAAKGGTGDEVLVVMAKGLTDATAKIGELAGMILNLHKGKKPPAEDAPAAAAAGGGSDDDDDDDSDDEGDDAPGYQNMQLALAEGVVLPGADGKPPTHLDVSKFVFDTGARIETLCKAVEMTLAENRSLKKLLRKALKGQTGLAQMIEASANAQVGAIAPLAKAVADGREALLNIPAAGITPARFSHRPPAADVVLLGGSKRAELQTLAKAMRTGLIDADMKAMFETSRKFSRDEATHTAVAAKVQAVAAEFAPVS